MISRIIGGIGRTMIAVGVLTLLFVTYQLWGTGLRTSQAQANLSAEFEEQLKQRSTQSPGSTTLPDLGEASSTVQPPGTTLTPESTVTTAPAVPAPPVSTAPEIDASAVAPKRGGPIGQIVIDTIGVDFMMVEGVELSYLEDGPGHFPGTPFPGQAGNAALAGHRTTYQAPFNRIDELIPGDLITVVTLQGRFTYRVIPQPGAQEGEQLGHFIVNPSQLSILDQAPGSNRLTLMACHPKYTAEQRIVVVGELIDNPAPQTAKSVDPTGTDAANTDPETLFGGSGGDLIGGDSAALRPALGWGAVAGFVWLLAWIVARRWPRWRNWRRWTTFAGALPIFLVPVFFAFESINSLLPAGY